MADMVIWDATVFDGTGADPVDNTAIRISGGRIKEVSRASGQPPAGVDLIAASGKFVVPGLVDAHTHIDAGPESVNDTGLKDLAVRYWPWAHLYNGVTTVLNMSARNPDALRKHRDLINAHPSTVSPRIFTGALHFTALGGWGARRGGAIEEDSDIAERVVRYHHDGFDLVKIINEDGIDPRGSFPKLSAETIAKIAEAARSSGLPLFVHATGRHNYLESAKVAPRALAHGLLELMGDDEGQLIETLLAHGTYVVPTISLFDRLVKVEDRSLPLDDPTYRKSVPDFVLKWLDRPDAARDTAERMRTAGVGLWHRDRVEDLMQNTQLFAGAGIPLAAGTDAGTPGVTAGPGYGLTIEIELLAGLVGPKQALLSATRVGAEIMNMEAEFGQIVPGCQADLLLLDGNPLEDITQIRNFDRLVVRGRLIERDELSYAAFMEPQPNKDQEPANESHG